MERNDNEGEPLKEAQVGKRKEESTTQIKAPIKELVERNDNERVPPKETL